MLRHFTQIWIRLMFKSMQQLLHFQSECLTCNRRKQEPWNLKVLASKLFKVQGRTIELITVSISLNYKFTIIKVSLLLDISEFGVIKNASVCEGGGSTKGTKGLIISTCVCCIQIDSVFVSLLSSSSVAHFPELERDMCELKLKSLQTR